MEHKITDEIKTSEIKRFSFVARAKSFTHAGRGLWIFFKSTHNAWLHVLGALVAITVGFVVQLNATEWIFVIFAIGFVLVAEAFNTAIEIDIDLTSPNFHPYAKDTKDVAAGAVLLSALTAAIVGGVIFIPKIIALFP